MCPGEETIAAWIAGQLSRQERDEFESHLDTCHGCQQLVATLAKLQPGHAPHDASLTSLGVPSIGASRESASWVPGGQLGRYVLLARLGAGGMGVVYAAYDPELDRRVALKVLRNARAGVHLRDEARAAARLAHPNVIAVHDIGEADGEVFIAMEHVDGVTVRDWLRTGTHTPAEIIDVFVQAGRGLAAAHRVGLVHRDVKPSNIIVGADGRARVLDFGLASAADDDSRAIVGTPAYMAPEQERADRLDARADQYSFCIALWESLAGSRPDDPAEAVLPGVPERVIRALRRGLSRTPVDRFPTMDALLAELAPPPRHGRRWIIATGLAVVALVGTLAITLARDPEAPACARTGAPLAQLWGPAQRAATTSGFAATGLPYAASTAASTIAELDRWATRWNAGAEATCRATIVSRVQPAALHALRQTCLEQLLEQLAPVVALTARPDAEVVARASSLVSSLPSPERCDDVVALAALPSLPPAERDRAAIAAIRSEIADHEAALLAGRAIHVRDAVLALRTRVNAIPYLPLRARMELLLGRLEVSSANYLQGIAALHTAARAATASRDLELLAQTWIELSKTLGNDLRTAHEAEVFDGYAEAVASQLPDHAALALDLAFARCNRNVEAKQAAAIAARCTTAIELAEQAKPVRTAVVIASRTRLGHFQRVQGQGEIAIATLRATVEQATGFHGPQHPDVAIARYALGIALLSSGQVEPAIAELRSSLEIRRAAFPAASIQVAESYLGLGDALSTAGDHAAAVTALEQALAAAHASGQGEGGHAANANILIGMSLEELERADDAIKHYLRAADIADRSLQNREALAAMGLRLAGNAEVARTRPAAAVPYYERALRLLERGKAPPAELGDAQGELAEVLFLLGPSEHARATALAEAARASFVSAGPAGAKKLPGIEALLQKHRTRR